jgi:sugar phosphate isomerase/epimerase
VKTKIFVTSASVKAKKIKDSILSLMQDGHRSIELTGGTEAYPELEDDLTDLIKAHDLEFILHNYFPPAKNHFILNLASLDEQVYQQSIEHIKNAIILSEKIGSTRYGIHAGYYKDLRLDEIGKPVLKTKLNDKTRAYDRFCASYNTLASVASDHNVTLYIENNVHAITNKEAYGDDIPIMLVTPDDYFSLKRDIDFPLLLDHAHLYVSCMTLGIDYEDAINKLMPESDYWHLSDNDGKHDNNQAFKPDSPILAAIQRSKFTPKLATIEVYASKSELQSSKEAVINSLI